MPKALWGPSDFGVKDRLKSCFLKLTMQFFSFAVEKTIDKAKFGNIYL